MTSYSLESGGFVLDFQRCFWRKSCTRVIAVQIAIHGLLDLRAGFGKRRFAYLVIDDYLLCAWRTINTQCIRSGGKRCASSVACDFGAPTDFLGWSCALGVSRS